MYIDPNQQVEQKRAEFRDELTRNEKLWEHYAEYREADVKSLIDGYALDKARLKVQGNYTRRHHEMLVKEWTDRAWFALCEIQSKKLFDLQCRWRAGEIPSLPGIRWTYDFDRLPDALLDYERVPAITEKEIEAYIQFLKTPRGQVWIYYGLDAYQEYSQIKEAHFDGKGFMPEYYEYHYTVFGNTGLLSLQDIREDEERRLIDLAVEFNRKSQEEKKQQQVKAKQQPPPKKALPYYDKQVKVAMAEFLGEKDVAGFIRDLEKWVKEKPEYETDWAMDYLSRCYPDDVPMPAAPRWQDAIQQAALQHITLKVQETLPVVHEEYQMKKQLGTAIGYVQGAERNRMNHPLIWMLELGERLDRGEDVDPDEVWKRMGLT